MMKILLLFLTVLCFTSCGLFRATPTKRLAIDTSVVLYRTYEYEASNDSSAYIYLPKHYTVQVSEGPDFDVVYYTFDSRDSADGYIGFAGCYEGMAAQRTGPDEDEVFVEKVIDTLKTGRIQAWDIYKSSQHWSMKTSERLYGWAYAPTRHSLNLWNEILRATEYSE
jgi:hypothetical protein